MVTNISKTEAVIFGSDHQVQIEIDNEKITSGSTMKVLGVMFDNRLKWNQQVDNALLKGRKLCSGLSFIRNKLTKEQFIKVMTCQFYSTVYYGCEVWLQNNTFNDLRRLNALHYRSLRIVAKDYKRRMHRADLDEIGRARPSTWSKYMVASRVIKIINCGFPHRLNQYLKSNSYVERRRPGRLKFYDGSRTVPGRQTLKNRAGSCLNDANFDWFNLDISKDCLRINLKKLFKMSKWLVISCDVQFYISVLNLILTTCDS